MVEEISNVAQIERAKGGEYMEKYIEALKNISYFEWVKLREGIDSEFDRQIGESKRSLQLTDSENAKRIIRSRFGGKLD